MSDMGRPPRFDLEVARQIAAEHASGVSINQLCRRYEAKESTIKNAVKRAGGDVQLQPLSSSNLRDDDKPRLIRMYRQGWTVQQLAREFRTQQARISSLLDDAFEPRHRPGTKSNPNLRTAAQCKRILERRRAGVSTATLAAELGMKPCGLESALARRGFPLSSVTGCPVGDAEQCARLYERRRSGERTADLAAELGMKHGSFTAAMARRGFPLAPLRTYDRKH